MLSNKLTNIHFCGPGSDPGYENPQTEESKAQGSESTNQQYLNHSKFFAKAQQDRKKDYC